MSVDIVVPDRNAVVEVVTAPTSAIVDIALLGPPGLTGPPGPAVDTASLYAGLGYLAVGQETMPRWAAASSAAVNFVTGRIRFGYVTARKSETIRSLRFVSSTAAAATPTTIKFGVYSVAGNGDLTRIGVTANDVTALSASNTPYQRALLTPAPVVAGQLYAIGLLVVTAVATPTVWGNNAAGSAAESNQSPRLCAYIDGQSDLGVSYTAAQVLGSPAMAYAVMVP